jgi:hypothetical protein
MRADTVHPVGGGEQAGFVPHRHSQSIFRERSPASLARIRVRSVRATCAVAVSRQATVWTRPI